MRSFLRVVPFVVATCLATLALADSLPAFEGRYRLEDPEGTRRETRAAMGAAVAGVTPSMRPVFEGALASMLTMPRAIAIRVEAGVVHVKRDGTDLEAPLDAREHPQRGDAGHSVRVVHRLDGEVLVEEQRTRNGVRADRLERRGDLLLLHAELRGPMLREPVRVEARYRVVPEEPSPPPTDDTRAPAR